MSTSITVRLPDDMAEGLEALAKALDRPRSYLVKKAMEVYLDEYADYLLALERLQDKDDRVISSGELRKRLAIPD
ncbi:MAG: ribbon-helix-helix protein, CopG family [Methanomicrobiales archaeon]|nr:ribbon-helix-helix protein, CopG family [Methanomicrobiales archaeon]